MAGRHTGAGLTVGRALVVAIAPPIAWSVQLWALAMLGDVPCREPGGSAFLGLHVELWWIIVSVVSACVAGAALVIAARSWRRTSPALDGDRSGGDLIAFLTRLGVLSGALFLATIFLGGTAPAFLDCA